MILTKEKIKENYEQNRITISPFDASQLSTNSYDLRLGHTLLKYDGQIIDPKNEPKYETIQMDDKGYTLGAGEFVLGHSNEKIGSDFYVPLLHGKSNTARMGLFVHVTADLIDIGFHGNFTLQLFATTPVKIYPGMLIAQVTFWVPYGEIELYNGKYQNSQGPRISKIYKDF